MRKFIISCKNEKCKKPILKSNPVVKKTHGSFTWQGDLAMMSVSAVDMVTQEPVVMPNVFCPHCKYKNVFEPADILYTDKMSKADKEKLDVKIKSVINSDETDDKVSI